jgi:hypothetical protein
MLVQPVSGLATFAPEAPKYFRKMHTETPRLGSYQGDEHLRSKPGTMLLAPE